MGAEKSLTPHESLHIITEAITKLRENFQDNSFGFLLWGWLIAGASFAFFLLQHYTGFQYYFIPFPVLVAVGIVVTYMNYRKKVTKKTLSYTAYFINKMWAVLGLGFIMVVFINVSQGTLPFTYTLVIAGIGTLVSGWVIKFLPLTVGGLFFLVAAIVSIYISDEFKPLLHGVAIVAGYLIPGYLLKNAKA